MAGCGRDILSVLQYGQLHEARRIEARGVASENTWLDESHGNRLVAEAALELALVSSAALWWTKADKNFRATSGVVPLGREVVYLDHVWLQPQPHETFTRSLILQGRHRAAHFLAEACHFVGA